MKKSWFIFSVVFFSAGLLLWVVWLFSKPVSVPAITVVPTTPETTEATVLQKVDMPQVMPVLQQSALLPIAAEKAVDHDRMIDEDVFVPAWQPNAEAVSSMSAAREQGDARTPPVSRHKSEESKPTDEELTDPDLYLQYEARQQQVLYRGYVEASETKIHVLEDAVARAKAEGMPAEEIAMAEEKIRGIKAMRAQLLAENPGLMDAGSP